MGGLLSRGDRFVVLIGVFKLVKCALLIALGIGWSVGVATRGSLIDAAVWTGAFQGHHVLRHALVRLASLSSGEQRALAIGAFGYAALFAVEGGGLILRRHWAEWMTVLVTASFIPLEIYELAHRPGAAKIVALALNAGIVAYLVRRRLAAPARLPA